MSRIPADLEASRNAHPDGVITESTGLVYAGRREVVERYDWSPASLAGFVYATSFLPLTIFGDRTTEFDADLAGRLEPYLCDGVVTDQVSYAYDLFSRPAPADT